LTATPEPHGDQDDGGGGAGASPTREHRRPRQADSIDVFDDSILGQVKHHIYAADASDLNHDVDPDDRAQFNRNKQEAYIAFRRVLQRRSGIRGGEAPSFIVASDVYPQARANLFHPEADD
jgi:hypothetical protein